MEESAETAGIYGGQVYKISSRHQENTPTMCPILSSPKIPIPEKTFFKNLKNQTNLTNIEVQFSTLTHRNFRPVIRDLFGKKFLSKWLSNKILSKQAETFDIKANSILQIFKKPAQKFIQNMPENHIFGTKKIDQKIDSKKQNLINFCDFVIFSMNIAKTQKLTALDIPHKKRPALIQIGMFYAAT